MTLISHKFTNTIRLLFVTYTLLKVSSLDQINPVWGHFDHDWISQNAWIDELCGWSHGDRSVRFLE